MSFYGQGGNPGVPNQAQIVRAAANAGSLQPQLFGQLQFPQVSQPNPFEQSNHLLLQSQGPGGGFQSLSFLSEQLAAAAGMGQMISQTSNAATTLTLPNLITPMAAVSSLNFPVATPGPAQPPGGQKQRVFTGTVSKAHDNFGFIDDEVFYTTAVVKGPVQPKPGDRVLVEAEYNGSAAFKWTATRIQIITIGGGVNNLPITLSSISKGSNSMSYQQGSQVTDKAQMNRIQSHLIPPPPPVISHNTITSQAGIGTIARHPASSTDGVTFSSARMTPTPSSLRPRPGDPLLTMQFTTHNTQIPSLFTSDLTSNVLRTSERDLERLEREREKERERDREREREIEREQREREREKLRKRDRVREKEKGRELEVERERERERRRRTASPPQKKVKSDSWHERQLGRVGHDRATSRDTEGKDSRTEAKADRNTAEVAANASPASSSTSKRRSRSRSPLKRPQTAEKDTERERTRSSRAERTSPARRSRSRSHSTSNKSSRYNVIVPLEATGLLKLSVVDLKRRYQRLYIPSEFFSAHICWHESFPLDKPMQLPHNSSVHVFKKEAIDIGYLELTRGDGDTIHRNIKKIEFVHDPEDARYLFSAKVMILFNSGEHSERIQRLLNFVIGTKVGKPDFQAIGGPWSAALDGGNPESDPQVLIRTAIRTTKTSIGIDLSNCKTWFRFMELYYRRANGVLETVVYFIPDISSCLPTSMAWNRIRDAYHLALNESTDDSLGPSKTITIKSGKSHENSDEKKLDTIESSMEKDNNQLDDGVSKSAGDVAESIHETPNEVTKGEVDEEGSNGLGPSTGEPKQVTCDTVTMTPTTSKEIFQEQNDVKVKIETGLDTPVTPRTDSITDLPDKASGITSTGSPQIDPAHMNVAKLKEELSQRGLSTKGLKAQLQTRLYEALIEEAPFKIETKSVIDEVHENTMVEEITNGEEKMILSNEENIGVSGTIEEPLQTGAMSNEDGLEDKTMGDVLVPLVPSDATEATWAKWRRRFQLPKKPHVIVHPLQGGKNYNLDCEKVCLASLLEYRIHNIKEQTFEVSLFAELFNEMLARDFAFKIYKEAFIRTQLLPPEEPKKIEKSVKEGQGNEKPKDTKLVKDEKLITNEEKKKDEKSLNKDARKDDVKKGERRASDASSANGESKKSPKTTNMKKTSDKRLVIDEGLLSAFTFFDSNRCGYIREGEFEDICFISGLNLTRSQVKKVIDKLFEKDVQFNYKKWTENPITMTPELETQLTGLPTGNKFLLPVFVYSGSNLGNELDSTPIERNDSSLFPIGGSVFDLQKFKGNNEKHDLQRSQLEANLNALGNNLNDARVQVVELRKSNETLKSDYVRLKDQSKASESLVKTQAEDLDTFRRATERFFDRVKGLIEVKNIRKEDSNSIPSTTDEKSCS